MIKHVRPTDDRATRLGYPVDTFSMHGNRHATVDFLISIFDVVPIGDSPGLLGQGRVILLHGSSLRFVNPSMCCLNPGYDFPREKCIDYQLYEMRFNGK